MEKRFRYLREIRLQYVALPERIPARERLRTPAAVAAYLRPLFELEPCEQFGVLMLDAKLRPLGVSMFGRGAIDGVLITPQAVFTSALLANASTIVTAHNHPSGDTLPSPDDL